MADIEALIERWLLETPQGQQFLYETLVEMLEVSDG